MSLSHVHRALAAKFDLQNERTPWTASFGASVPHWPAFPDTADALRFLQTRFRLVILSNISKAAFRRFQPENWVSSFDAIYTAEGHWLPTNRTLPISSTCWPGYAVISTLTRTIFLHTAQSLYHDHVPARAFGLANAWIDRQRLSEKGSWGATVEVTELPDYDFPVFSQWRELAAAVAPRVAPGIRIYRRLGPR